MFVSSELVTDQCHSLCTDYLFIGENREERKIHQDIAETDNEQSNHHGSGEIPTINIYINTCTVQMMILSLYIPLWSFHFFYRKSKATPKK